MQSSGFKGVAVHTKYIHIIFAKKCITIYSVTYLCANTPDNCYLCIVLAVSVLMQYNQTHGVKNPCDRLITLLSDTDISFALFILITYFLVPLR
jgi:hypothetical protein